MLTYTHHTLTKIEDLLKALGYKVRYEKGSFKNGTCILQQENILVVNRFSTIEMKINSMLQVIQSIDFFQSIEDTMRNDNLKEIQLDEKQRKLFHLLHQMRLEL